MIPSSYLQDSEKKMRVLEEIKIHKKLLHKNILKFEHYIVDEKDNIHLITQLCPNGHLGKLLDT